MIRVLAREQWRFQRMYIVWAAAIVAAAVGFATFASVSAATQGSLDQYSGRVLMEDAPHNDPVELVDPSWPVPDSPDYSHLMTAADLGLMIDKANADGARAYAYASEWTTLSSSSAESSSTTADYLASSLTVSAVWGEPDWNAILAEGTAPGPDDIVLPANTARMLDVGIGDTVQVGHLAQGTAGAGTLVFVRDADLTVSGLAYDVERYTSTGPAYTSHEQLPMLTAANASSGFGQSSTFVSARVGWQHESTALDPLSNPWGAPGMPTFGSSAPLPWLLAALFTAGAIVTAFTLGRAQAQSRVRWVATARALGAKRSHLLGVAGLEWAIVGGAGAASGISLGWIAATWAHARRMASFAAAPPVGISFPMLVVVLLLALAALLAAAIVSVPSVIALRVSPTAALKPSAGADAMQLSRRVKFWPVPLLFVLLWIATAALNHNTTWQVSTLTLLATVATLAAGVAVVVESCRALVRATARRLARSHRPWAVHASMTMTGHPQQISALAIVQALLMTGIGGVIMAADPSSFTFGWTADAPLSQLSLRNRATDLIRQAIPSPLTVPTVIALVIAIQFLVIAIAASARRVSWSESSTAGALGLTGAAAARGDAFAWWAAQAHGTWVGLCAGVFGVGAIWIAAWTSSYNYAGDVLGLLPLRVGGAAGVALVSLAVAAVVSGLAGALLRPRVPANAPNAAS